MIRYLLFLLWVGYCGIALGQDTHTSDCGTEFSPDPTFDRAAYESFKRTYQSRSVQRGDEITVVPVVARIVRHTDGTGGLSLSELPEIMDSLNKRFEGVNMQFQMCGPPEFVDVNVFYDFDRGLYADSLVTYNIPNVINIYFINKILNDASFLCGYASFPWFDQEYVVVKNSCALNGSTLAHEVGHYLGLYHTHETFLGNEYADGSNCLFTGDELCDTPADPRLGTNNVSSICEYTGTSRDLNGDRYRPDPTNIMSYSRKACRTFFSEDQSTRMNFYLQKDRSHLNCTRVTSTDELVDFQGVTLAPNPAQDRVKLSWESTLNGELEVEVLDLQGRLMLEEKVKMYPGSIEVELPVAHLGVGVYVVQLKVGEHIKRLRLLK